MSQKIREILNNLIYQLYVNKNESRTQKEEDDKNERDIAQAHQAIISAILEKMPNKERILAHMLNQIPPKYHNDQNKIAEFGDIIEETINQTLAEIRENLKKC